MINLAGRKDADQYISIELTHAKIDTVTGDLNQGEVAYTITGKLGSFIFKRAWYYWIVTGPVPLKIAEELYADPCGKDDIRVTGDCTCPPPRDRVDWYDGDGNQLFPIDQESEYVKYAEKSDSFREILKKMKFVEDPTQGHGFIDLYHIDSELGLRLFADAVRDYNLDKVDPK